MTTSSTRQPLVTVSGPGDLVSLVPYLVGFQPRRSLVVMSLRGDRLRCGLTARFDLPPDLTLAPAFAADVAQCVLRDSPSQVALLVYDDEPWASGARPWQQLVDEVESAFDAVDVPVKEAAYVGAERYWSFTCTSSSCCPDDGTSIAAVRSSPAATAFVMLGRAPLADREQLVARVAARGPLTTSVVATVAERELDRLADAEATSAAAVLAWRSQVLSTFGDLVARAERVDAGAAGESAEPAGPTAVAMTADEAALLAAGLLDVELRDEVMERCTAWSQAMPGAPLEGDPVRPCPYDQDPVTAVLLALATMTDDVLAVAPLTLLTAQLWGAGEGALANAAVERALAIDPDYRLALLLGQVLRAAIPPAWAARPEDPSRLVRG